MKRTLGLFFGIAMAVTGGPLSAATRLVDFESPASTRTFQPASPESYSAFNGEVRFTQGWRAVAGVWEGTPPSTTYFNFSAGQVIVLFSVPVKNISFTMYSFFYNTDRGSAAIIKYSSIAFDPTPRTLSPNPILYYAPDYGGGTTVNVPFDNIRYLVISFGAEVFAIDDLSFEDATPSYDYSLTGQILDGSGQETKHVGTATTAYAQVPLGLELKLALLNNGSPVTAQYTLAPAALTGVANPTLYPTNVVLEYDRDTSAASKTFRAVHIGTQTLYINPGPTTPVLNVTVGVFDPGALGNSDVQYDSMIVTWGNRRGIPPNVLKGLIKKETGFDPMSYRYEPLNHDTGDIGVTTIQNLLEDEPYEHYRMATAAGSSKGDLLIDLNSGNSYTTSDDVSPRQPLRRNNGQHLTPQDVCPARCVSARELLLANDGSQHWTDFAAFDPADPADLASIDFTAQTTLAASYGLMQEMYVVASELGWSTTDGRQNPSLLFDTPDNINIGGGSLAVGTWEFYKRYRKCRTGDWATDPGFDDPDAYKNMITDALNYYNHGPNNVNMTYGADIWSFAQQFSPTHPLSKIFP